VAAAGAAPAQAADFFARYEARNDGIEPVPHLLECFAEGFQGWLLGHGFLAGPATRPKQGCAPRRFDVKRELELLVPGSAPREESEKLPKVSHMFI
jgi:hypothetical protein